LAGAGQFHRATAMDDEGLSSFRPAKHRSEIDATREGEDDAVLFYGGSLENRLVEVLYDISVYSSSKVGRGIYISSFYLVTLAL
jgi:hypothetical protein